MLEPVTERPDVAPVLAVADFLRWLSQQAVCGGEMLRDFLSAGSVSYWDLLLPSVALYAVPKAMRAGDPDSRGWRRSWGKLPAHVRAGANVIRPHAASLIRTLARAGRARDRGESLGAQPLLFGAFEIRQAASLWPVIEELRRQGQRQVRMLVHADGLRGRRLPPGTDHALLFPVEGLNSVRLRKQAAATHLMILRRCLEALGSKVLRTTLEDWFQDLRRAAVFLEELRALFLNYGGRLAYHASYSEKLFRICSPRVFVAADDTDPVERVYFEAARKAGVPSLVVQYGSLSGTCVHWAFLLAERVAVFGESSRRRLLQQGIDPDRIVITGNPRFDSLRWDISGARLRVRERYQLAAGTKVILFTSQVNLAAIFGGSEETLSGQEYEYVLNTVYAAAAGLEHAMLLVKPHPDEDASPHRARLRSMAPQCIFCDRSVAIGELIQAADLVVTYNSTTGLEALVAGVPLVAVSPPGKMSFYARRGVAWNACDAAGLRALLNRLVPAQEGRVRDPDRVADFLNDEVWHPGQAAAAVGALIENMVSQPKVSEGAVACQAT